MINLANLFTQPFEFPVDPFQGIGSPVCTAVMSDGAGIIRDMNAGLSGYRARKHFAGVGELRGRALPRIGTHAALSAGVFSAATIGSPERCTSCRRCVVTCRDGGYHAISLADRKVVIDAARCDGWSLCLMGGPEGVIKMRGFLGRKPDLHSQGILP